jgi:lipopolysaccharide export system protein LptC
MSKWHYFSIFLLSLVLALVLWQAPPSELLTLSEKENLNTRLFPNAYLIKSKTTQYSVDGKISHLLTADRIRLYEPTTNIADNYALLDLPNITVYSQKQPEAAPWNASSLYGKSTKQDEELLLTGNVVLIQTESTTQIASTITSDELLIKPNQQYAETNKPVIIKTQSGVTSSVGLKMSLDTDTIELLSNVRSRYEPR